MLGITLGDPNGVGPEILIRSFMQKDLPGDVVVIGDYDIVRFCMNYLKLNVPLARIRSVKDLEPGRLNILDQGCMKETDLTIGKISEKGGGASLKYIEIATELALSGKIDAIITLPVHKEAVRLVHKDFRGHTDHIAALCGVNDFTMMLVSDRLIVTHISMHVSMKEAIDKISIPNILGVIRLTDKAVSQLRNEPKLAVAGLNPHAGEHGAFGDEEIAYIVPAVARAREEGIRVSGPFPPDTLFFQAVQGKFDAVVCMYHDQGHIPLKLLAFDEAVNVTLGLPIIRTSVDHGTAYDIAYRGMASVRSFVNAVRLADRMVDAGKLPG